METPSMTEDDVRAAAERLVQFHERLAPLFGREEAQDHAYTYIKGLMVCPERKSIEPIALNVGFFAYPPEKVYSRHDPVVTDGAEGVSPR
jgi:hypothetical protein